MEGQYDPEKHHRRSIRLQGYDYARSGAYFVTLCAHGRQCIFGEIVDGAIRLSPIGKIVETEWLRTAEVRPGVELDAFVIMPNHVHALLFILEADPSVGQPVGATRRVAPNAEETRLQRPTGPTPGSLGAIMSQFRSVVTKRVNKARGTPGAPVWQRGYYEHVVRSDEELTRLRQYIMGNPLRWDLDDENPTYPS